MQFDFDFEDVSHQELLIAIGDQDTYARLIVDASVQTCLKAMLGDTVIRFAEITHEEIPTYELAEKYSTEELVKASVLGDEYANLQKIFDLEGVAQSTNIVMDISRVSYYIYKVVDRQNRRLVAVKKAHQFKGLASAHGRLVSWLNDSLTIIEKPVFKLDRDFDLVITATEVFALRPNTLAFVAEVSEAATAAAGERLNAIGASVSFLALDRLKIYVASHKRGAHLVSAISGRDDLARLSKDKMSAACAELGIQLEATMNGSLGPMPGHEIALLELLDNRRYVTSLTEDAPKSFIAASRRQVSIR